MKTYRLKWTTQFRTGYHLSGKAFNHHDACTIMSKITKYAWRLDELEEVTA